MKQIVLIAVVTHFFTGCSSLNAHFNGEPRGLYPGVKSICLYSTERIREKPEDWPVTIFVLPVAVIDLPLSAVADTFFLPSDIKCCFHEPVGATNQLKGVITP
jgi:uncharacterized protein YceK